MFQYLNLPLIHFARLKTVIYPKEAISDLFHNFGLTTMCEKVTEKVKASDNSNRPETLQRILPISWREFLANRTHKDMCAKK